MRLIKMKKPQCMIYATAMLIDEKPSKIIKELGHDGSKGVHIQEILHILAQRGLYLSPVEPLAILDGRRVYSLDPIRVYDYLKIHDALLIGNKPRHAVAWDSRSNKCYDPNGLIYDINKFQIQEAWLLIH